MHGSNLIASGLIHTRVAEKRDLRHPIEKARVLMDYLVGGLTLAVCLLGAAIVVRSGARRVERRLGRVEQDLRRDAPSGADGEMP